MSSFLNDSVIGIGFRLLIILLAALLVNRLARALTQRMVRPASGSSKADQTREQQSRTLADFTYKICSGVIWTIAALTAFALIGVNELPALTVIIVGGIAAGLAGQNVLRDVIAGYHIVLEDQYVAGETVQIGEATGKVEQLTLRRTVLRDARGALVTIGNGEVRSVANLSRDWSQTFIDVALAPETPLEKPLAALESAAAELRADSAWSQALVDGPRVLGVISFDRYASVVRLQVRTLPMRQDEIARELRRRIQLEFQKRSIPVASVLRFEFSNPQAVAGETPEFSRQ
jgi:small conductance mechanosensitive channel